MIIFCLPPLSQVLDNLADDPDNLAIKRHAQKIYWAYFNRAASWPYNDGVYIWDYTRHNYDGLLALVKDWMKKKGLKFGG